MDIKEHFGYTHKGISRPIYSFLPGVPELKLDVIDPIIL